MLKEKWNAERLLTVLFLASVFLLAIIKIEDTDAWIHLGFGRLIWELKGFPGNEPFVYTMFDKPFSYSSWLFGLTYYLAYKLLNVYGVVLLKATTITTAFAILLRDSLKPYNRPLVAIAVMSVMVILLRFRFVERPDTFLMVFLAFTIFSLNAFAYDRKKYLYALPFVHMLWANSHSSINLMVVPFAAFLAGGIIQHYLSKKNTTLGTPMQLSQLKTILIIFFASFAASLISPYFISQYTFGAQFLASPWFKQEISELQSPTWEFFKLPYILTGAVALSFALNWKRFSLIHLFLVIPFVILSFISIRFTVLLGVIAAPLLARNISGFLLDAEQWWAGFSRLREKLSGKGIAAAVVASWIILSSTLALSRVAPFETPEKEFGFGINYEFIPEEALRYMDRRAIEGRMFNLFQWGQYITWRDFPRRSVFIDGRGYITNDLLKKMELVPRSDSIMKELQQTYGFEVVLLPYPIVETDVPGAFSQVDVILSHPGWALVYWDDISLVYLKRGGKYEEVIQQDEYQFVKPAGSMHDTRILADGEFRDRVISELERNIQETGSSKAYALLGTLYNKLARHREAIDAFSHVRERFQQSDLLTAYFGTGYSYFSLNEPDESIRWYRKALSLNETAEIYYNIGTSYVKKRDNRAALKYFKKALKKDPTLISVYPLLIGIYNDFGMETEAREARAMFESAKLMNSGQRHFEKGVKAYLAKQYGIALGEFQKSMAVNPSNPAPYTNIGYIYFDMGQTGLAYEYQRKALEADPEYANAHYGLALVYTRQGNIEMAKQHWKEYLRIEPEGYFSRKAMKALSEIRDNGGR